MCAGTARSEQAFTTCVIHTGLELKIFCLQHPSARSDLHHYTLQFCTFKLSTWWEKVGKIRRPSPEGKSVDKHWSGAPGDFRSTPKLSRYTCLPGTLSALLCLPLGDTGTQGSIQHGRDALCRTPYSCGCWCVSQELWCLGGRMRRQKLVKKKAKLFLWHLREPGCLFKGVER